MISFESDYIEGAHPQILERLVETNFEQLSGYGDDKYSHSAKEKIKALCQSDDVEVFLLTGGTQTNQIIIDTLLNSFEGVIAADTGHIATHEAGAIEFTGHKVLTLPQYEGKIKPEDLRKKLSDFYVDENYEHTVFPGMVYISHPTEYGTLYSAEELTELSSICKQYKIPLYMDGARLGYALESKGTDVSLPLIAKLCDAFYIGGTKVGALCGEAVVFTRGNTPKHFFTSIKQHGALLAKGRLTGVQFDTLFTNDLYFEISRHAINMADKLREAFREKGYQFYIETVTNQIFIVLNEEQKEKLNGKVAYGYWETLPDGRTVVRLATSWATTEENVKELIDLI